MMTKKWTLKNLILLSTVVIAQIHTIFWGVKTRVDMYLLIDITRRKDIAIMYLTTCINFVILAYCLKYPKGIFEGLKSFILVVTVVDLLHYLLLSKLYFGMTKKT